MIRVHSLETFGTHEGPGLRYVVFLQGCHFRCLYCHNPDTWGINGGSEYTVEDIIQKVEQNKPYFGDTGGLTVSGGEPLLQREEVYTLFKKAHSQGINTALDTNGSILDDAAKKLLEEADLVLLDIKHIDDTQHKKLTGVSNYMPLAFAEYLDSIKKPFWVRHVLVPGYTDQKPFLHTLGKKLATFTSMERVEILPYHMYGAYKYEALGLPYQLKNVLPPTAKKIAKAQAILKNYINDVRIR